MAEVVFDHVTRIYPGNDKPSVDDLNLDIKDGEFLVLVGPSGCGKSTTLRMLAGLEEVNKGRILIGGKDVTTMQPKDRDIAMVFQNYALYPHMTVADNMGFALKIAGTPKDEIRKRVEKAAEILDLTEYLDRKPKALSGGQRQRVAMGRAIVREPKVFLMDEPLSNLDAKLRTSMRAEIARLHKRLGTTFVYVTHDQTEAMTMGDRIVVMKSGIIQQADTPTNLYNKPCNMFVAGFIGSPQMNFMDCVCKIEGDKVTLTNGDATYVMPANKAKALKDGGYDGKTVVFGIRPDDMDDYSEYIEKHAGYTIKAKCTGYELLGSEVLLYYTTNGVTMTAKVDSTTPCRYGDDVTVAFDIDKGHIFDKETEQIISH